MKECQCGLYFCFCFFETMFFDFDLCMPSFPLITVQLKEGSQSVPGVVENECVLVNFWSAAKPLQDRACICAVLRASFSSLEPAQTLP